MTHVTPNLGAVGIASPVGHRGAGSAPTRSQVQARYASSRHRAAGRSGLGSRHVLIGALAVLTIAAVGFLVLRGGGDAAAAGDFISSHDRAVAAASQVPLAAANVQRDRELNSFNRIINGLLNDMGRERDAFVRIARDSGGASKVAALRASHATTAAIDASDDFRRAVAFSRKLAQAQAAQQRLSAAVAELDASATDWKQA